MTDKSPPLPHPSVIDRNGLDALIGALKQEGYQVIGPKAEDGAIVYQPLDSADCLPAGRADKQDGGSYRLVQGRDGACFDHVVGPQTWKRYLYPPRQKLWRTERRTMAFVSAEPAETPRYAFLGVRACDLRAIQIQDRVFDNGDFVDPGYKARREAALIVAVNCGRAGGTCFCVSMDCGPRVGEGYDLALTELVDGGRHDFLIQTGSGRGAAVMAKLPRRDALKADIETARAAVARAAEAMGRQMIADPAPLLKRNLEHRRWKQTAERCLGCANCTMVCPTCFCSTMEDVTDLGGGTAERWRRWDSCFTLDFSYIHGGVIRRQGMSRYRQWMTHKLATWHDQFQISGCVGCGRCITWCPVGIDITEEAKAIQDSEERA